MTEWKADRIKGVSDVKAFFRYLTEKLGNSWHVDTDFGDYVDSAGKSTFAHKEAETLNTAMETAVAVCTGRGKQSDSFRDVYQIALETMGASGIAEPKHKLLNLAADHARLIVENTRLKAERDELLGVCKADDEIELLFDERSTCYARLNDRSLTAESHIVSKKCVEEINVRLREIRSLRRVAIGKAEENEER